MVYMLDTNIVSYLLEGNEEHLGRIDGLCIENWAI